MQDSEVDLVIVGAGVTGLAAAYYAQKAGLNFRILDSAQRAGGKIQTEQVTIGAQGSFLLEYGADSMIALKPEGVTLAHELGLQHELVGTRTQRQIYVLKRDELVPMPEGLQLVIPQKLLPFIRSPLFSLKGKLRMGVDLLLPKRVSDADESVANFIRRRLGQEALNFLAEPILSGIYSADPERQSIRATFPQLCELERTHRSLILGALAPSKKPNTGPIFVSFRKGMQTLTDALAKSVESSLSLNCSVTSLQQNQDMFELRCTENKIQSRRVILTGGPRASASLLKSVAPNASGLLTQLRLTSSGCVFLAYRKADVTRDLDGYGILIPKTEKRDINAVTWTSSKLEGRAPKSHVLLRVFFGGERNPSIMAKTDDEIVAIAEREAAALHGIKGVAVLARVFRAHEGNPQYDVGHHARVKQIEDNLPPGLIVTGCYMRGVGVPDCIRQAKEAVNRGVGAYVSFVDTEGNRVSMLQPLPMPKKV